MSMHETPHWESQTVGSRMPSRGNVVDSHHGPQATKAYMERKGWPIGWPYRGDDPFMSHPTPGPDGRLRTQQIATQDYMREPPPKTADRLANMLDYKQAQLLQAKEEEDWRRAKADGEYLKAAEAASVDPVPTRVPPPAKWGYCTPTTNPEGSSSNHLRERKFRREYIRQPIDEKLTSALFLSLSGGPSSAAAMKEGGVDAAAVHSPLIPLALSGLEDKSSSTEPTPPLDVEDKSSSAEPGPSKRATKKSSASSMSSQRAASSRDKSPASMRTSHGKDKPGATRRPRKTHSIEPPRPMLPEYATSPTVRAELYRREIERTMEMKSGSVQSAVTTLQAVHRRGSAMSEVRERRRIHEQEQIKFKRSKAASVIQARARNVRERRERAEAEAAAKAAELLERQEKKSKKKTAVELADELTEGGGGIGGVCGKCGRLVCGCPK